MAIQISRRGLIGGFASLLAAPAIVRASSLMPVKVISHSVPLPAEWHGVWVDARGLKVTRSSPDIVWEHVTEMRKEWLEDHPTNQYLFDIGPDCGTPTRVATLRKWTFDPFE